MVSLSAAIIIIHAFHRSSLNTVMFLLNKLRCTSPESSFLQNFYYFAIFLCVGTHMFALHDSVVYGYDRYLDATVVMLAAFARWCNAFESL